MSKLKIALDCDGVIIGFCNKICELANKKELELLDYNKLQPNFGFCYRMDEYVASTKWKYEHFIKDFRQLSFYGQWIEDKIAEKGFCYNLPILEGAQQFVEDLRKVGDVIFVTSAYDRHSHWHKERYEVLEKHFGATRDTVIFARAKNHIQSDYLIDDHITNVENWSKETYNGTAIIFEQPWNKEYIKTLNMYGNIVPAKNYEQVKQIIIGE